MTWQRKAELFVDLRDKVLKGRWPDFHAIWYGGRRGARVPDYTHTRARAYELPAITKQLDSLPDLEDLWAHLADPTRRELKFWVETLEASRSLGERRNPNPPRRAKNARELLEILDRLKGITESTAFDDSKVSAIHGSLLAALTKAKERTTRLMPSDVRSVPKKPTMMWPLEPIDAHLTSPFVEVRRSTYVAFCSTLFEEVIRDSGRVYRGLPLTAQDGWDLVRKLLVVLGYTKERTEIETLRSYRKRFAGRQADDALRLRMALLMNYTKFPNDGERSTVLTLLTKRKGLSEDDRALLHKAIAYRYEKSVAVYVVPDVPASPTGD